MLTLVVDGGVPNPGADGGSAAMRDLLRGLRRIGHRVFFFPDGHTGSAASRDLGALGDIPVPGTPFAGPAGLAPWIAAHRHALDFVFAARPGPAARYRPLFDDLPKARRIYFGLDIHFRRMAMGAAQGFPYAPLQLRGMEALERRLWRTFDAVAYPSAEECREVRAREPSAAPVEMPIFTLAVSPPAAGEPRPHRCGGLFVGGASHDPNRDAIAWFARDVLPSVRAACPDFMLRVAGAWPESDQRALRRDGLAFLGPLDDGDLAIEFGRARVSLAPLRFGGGVKHKVVAAMARGLPVVSTPVGLEGLRPEIGREAAGIRVESAADFTAAIVALAGDDELWRRVAAAGRDFCRAHYGEAAYDAALRRVLEAAARTGRTDTRTLDGRTPRSL